ncbi:MAG: DUF4349 domain-containing protein [Nocardioides sp.]
MTTAPRRRLPAAAAALALGSVAVLGTVLGGCSAGGSGGSAGSSADSAVVRGEVAGGSSGSMAAPSAVASAAPAAARQAAQVTAPAVISKGTVTLSAEDVSAARTEVQRVVDRYAGQVSDERTDTDGHGRVSDAHLVVRVPADRFEAAMADLGRIGRLEYSSATSLDVTTRVIDTRSRLRVQRASVARITDLLARAQDLRDVVLIEGQLAQRQATLESLERQDAYLADQTSRSTITVDVQRRTHAAPAHHTDHTGFLAGLAAGWHGLSALAVGLATATGATLPFAVALTLLAGLGWPLLRVLRRRHPADPGPLPTEG